MLTFNPQKRILARDALNMPFFTIIPTPTCIDFQRRDLVFTQPSTSLSTSNTTQRHTRSSLFVPGRNVSARPFASDRHSMRPVMQYSVPTRSTAQLTSSSIQVPPGSIKIVSPERPSQTLTTALSVDVNFNHHLPLPQPPCQQTCHSIQRLPQQHQQNHPLARLITGRRYTQPVRSRVSQITTRAKPIPEVPSSDNSPVKQEVRNILSPLRMPPAAPVEPKIVDSIRARPKVVARRRTDMVRNW